MLTSPLLTNPLRWLSSHPWVAGLAAVLFLPAIVMLLTHIVRAQAIATTTAALLITIALLLFCIELARMAYVDLNNVAMTAALLSSQTELKAATPETAAQAKDYSLLNRFFGITISTIALELSGFYLALFSLQWGALIVIFSQLWFNLLAGIQLFPNHSPAIVPFGIKQRIDVLAANSVAICLLCLWPISAMKLVVGIGLLTLITLFLLLKYAPFAYESLKRSQ
ncbi:MAG: hypothetical protein AAF703_16835 [Cyanobacteria bacterium P01_D01_bin.105]